MIAKQDLFSLVLGCLAGSALIWLSIELDFFVLIPFCLLATAFIVIPLWVSQKESFIPSFSPPLFRIFLQALLLRLSFTLFFQLGYIGLSDSGCLGPDAQDYYHQGALIGEALRDLSLNFQQLMQIGGGAHYGYSLFTGILFSVFGPHVLFVKLTNVFIGALTVVILFVIGKHLYNAAVARMAAYLCLLNPALIFWGGRHLKDALYAFLIVSLVLITIRLVKKPRFIDSLGFLIVSGFTFIVRGNLTYFLFMGLVVYLLANFLKQGKMLGLTKVFIPLIIVGLLILPYVPAAHNYISTTLQGELIPSVIDQGRRYWNRFDVERLGVEPSLGIIGIMKTLPLALGTVLMAPLPWSAEGVGIFKVPGALIRAFLYPLSLYGLFWSLREDWFRTFPLYFTPVVVTAGLIIIVMGGMARYQVPMLAPMLLLAAYGISHFENIADFYKVYLVILFGTYMILWHVDTGKLSLPILGLSAFFLILGGLTVSIHNRSRSRLYFRKGVNFHPLIWP